MRKRNCRLEVRFTKDELSDLTKKARKAHLSSGCFVRQAVSGMEIKEAPPADVPKLIFEVRRVGSILDQILKNADGDGPQDMPQLGKALEENRAVEKLIVEAYTQPHS